MKGKIGLIVGLGAGYVLGARAGRQRFEQIRTQWQKVWNLEPVQEQVAKVQEFARSQAAAVPGAVWNGAVKVVKSVSGSGTPGQKLDSAIDATKDAVDDVAEAREDKSGTKTDTAKKPGSSAGTASAADSTGKGAAKKNGS
ncbi:hypothetical protein [Microbacterium sp.]|uniref:hypothetical protein n=1 Tax=Microbacterium sp. TaxID=51671 RepID=UPI002811867F|nr:hypothetical protein [Microbacterium sp.]